MNRSNTTCAAAHRLIDRLADRHTLPLTDYERLIAGFTPELASYARDKATQARQSIYGNNIFLRGLIEVSNRCKNDCYYCGIRASNAKAIRYRLSPSDIMASAQQAYDAGCRTFVLQGGEDPWFTDERLCTIIADLKATHPDCAVTLSLGERSRGSYQQLFDAGADRYLLRHETASPRHYQMLHPANMSYHDRIRCLRNLQEIGFAVGTGFMVGSPGQTSYELARDLKLIEELSPAMCGIGPFVPHHATRFAHSPHGSVQLTCFLLSLLRIMKPSLLLPATTALGTVQDDGRELGILAGANVIMPNFSPAQHRAHYELYDHKPNTGAETAEGLHDLRQRVAAAGCCIAVDRGDPWQTAPLAPDRTD